MTHGWEAQVVKGTLEYPLSERTPKGFKDADPETETMSLQVDDVWRIAEMTIMLGVSTPLRFVGCRALGTLACRSIVPSWYFTLWTLCEDTRILTRGFSILPSLVCGSCGQDLGIVLGSL